jgi:hypothetical protein
MCSEVRPISIEDEKSLTHILCAELNAKFMLNLDTHPEVNRMVASDEELKLIMIGASHTVRLATVLRERGLHVLEISRPGLRILKGKIRSLHDDVREAVNNEIVVDDNTVAVCQLFDNSFHAAWWESDEECRLLPHRAGAGGTYHVDGAETVEPIETQTSLFKIAEPVLHAVEEMPTIILTPLPRYLYSRCCSDTGHVSNLEDAGYVKGQNDALEASRRHIKDCAWKNGFRCTRALNPGATLLRKFGNSQETLWRASPVHPSTAAYEAIADDIVETARDMLSKRRSKKRPPSPACSSPKRLRTDSTTYPGIRGRGAWNLRGRGIASRFTRGHRARSSGRGRGGYY